MIAPEMLETIAACIDGEGLDERTITQLRADYPKAHFTYCSEDDVPNNQPVLTREQFNLYLIDGREHCLCLTTDFAVATGIVVAEIYPE